MGANATRQRTHSTTKKFFVYGQYNFFSKKNEPRKSGNIFYPPKTKRWILQTNFTIIHAS
jgi:hypothetical protein